jgi:hypothetical protein
METLSKTNRQRLEHLIKNVADINNTKSVMDFINTKEKPNTIKAYTNSYIVYLRAIGNDTEANKLGKIRDKMTKTIVKQQKNQVLSKNREENQVSFAEILKKQKQYETLFKGNVQNNTYNIMCLILSLNSLIPPIRTEPLNMRIYDGFQPDITEENYIFRKKNIYYYRINKDKISGKIGKQSIKLTKRISILIDLSLTHFPRQYLLCAPLGKGQKPLSYTRFREIMQFIFDGKKVYTDILRSAYLTKFVKGRSISEIEKVAKKMRTSYETIVLHYVKIPRNKKARERYRRKKDYKKAVDDAKELIQEIFKTPKLEDKLKLMGLA